MEETTYSTVTLYPTGHSKKKRKNKVEILKQNPYDPLILVHQRRRPKRYRKPMLSTLDVLISVFIVSPCVVGYWRSVWQLMDIYIVYFPPMESFLLGAFVLTGCTLGQHLLYRLFGPPIEESRNNHVGGNPTAKLRRDVHWTRLAVVAAVQRCYTCVFAVFSIMHWKGGWNLLDQYFAVEMTKFGNVKGRNSAALLIGSGIALGAIICLKCLINNIAPPFIISVDRSDRYFTISTRFKTKMEERKSLYILDCLFSVIIVGTLVVFVWRGCWALFDIYLYPDNEIKSAWGSLIIGYSVVLVAFLLQPLMRWLCDRTKGAVRLLIADLFILFSFLGTINVWRGIWNLLNLYLLPDDLELSCWITHWVCLIILIMLGCSNSLLVRGVYIDAEEPAGKCVVFPCHYLRVILQEKNLTGNESNRNGIEGGHQEDTADINVECGPNGSAQLKHLPPPNSNVNVNNNNNNNSPGKRQQNSDDNNMVLDSCTKNHVYSINCDKTIPHQK